MNHDFHDREDDLTHCKKCNGAEGSLPTDCPGARMTDAQEAAVFRGHIDFVGNRWMVPLGPIAPETIRNAERYDFLRGAIHDEARMEMLGRISPNPKTDNEFDDAVDEAMRRLGVFTVHAFDAERERVLFEGEFWRHYLRVSDARAAAGVTSPSDPQGRRWTQGELFSRNDKNEYIAIAVQQAWGGWKLARGGV